MWSMLKTTNLICPFEILCIASPKATLRTPSLPCCNHTSGIRKQVGSFSHHHVIPSLLYSFIIEILTSTLITWKMKLKTQKLTPQIRITKDLTYASLTNRIQNHAQNNQLINMLYQLEIEWNCIPDLSDQWPEHHHSACAHHWNASLPLLAADYK